MYWSIFTFKIAKLFNILTWTDFATYASGVLFWQITSPKGSPLCNSTISPFRSNKWGTRLNKPSGIICYTDACSIFKDIIHLSPFSTFTVFLICFTVWGTIKSEKYLIPTELLNIPWIISFFLNTKRKHDSTSTYQILGFFPPGWNVILHKKTLVMPSYFSILCARVQIAPLLEKVSG